MIIEDIHSIKRKNLLISYRREYVAEAHIVIHHPPAKALSFEFSVELTPLGSSIYRVKLLQELEYPSLPLINALKEKVHAMDKAGSLP